jgi:hypothetical protein
MNGDAPLPDRLQWTVHPLRRSFKVSLAVSAIVAAVPVLIYLSYEDYWLSLVALVVLFFSLRAFYFPTHYTLDREGVNVACFPLHARRPWKIFKSWQSGEGAIRLSTFAGPSRLDAYRGLLLRIERGRPEIEDFLRQYIKPD